MKYCYGVENVFNIYFVQKTVINNIKHFKEKQFNPVLIWIQ